MGVAAVYRFIDPRDFLEDAKVIIVVARPVSAHVIAGTNSIGYERGFRLDGGNPRV